MRTIKFIINPSSGRKIIQHKLEELKRYLPEDKFEMQFVYTESKGDAQRFASEAAIDPKVDYIVACGGDGTVNEVAKGLYLSKIKKPFTIIPSGTVNDFASYLKLPMDMKKFAKILHRGMTVGIDLGVLNDEEIFINVAAGGFLVNVAHETNSNFKAVLGRLAYYFEGFKEFIDALFGNRKKMKLQIKSDEFSDTVDCMLFLVSNSSSIGGFKNAAPYASISDSMLDVLIVKDKPLIELAPVFFALINGEHIYNDSLIYFQTKSVEFATDIDIDLDIDGEYAGKLPAKIEVSKSKIQMLV